ncbi:MAG TPA: prolyl oligopeptidase family serine peptidase [Blastocatellia bacterium]|nr:prolyl oligopeptidase family serine peptidase [Blastocatellia bacterium]
MKTRLVSALLVACLALCAVKVSAQQIPFLDDLLVRSAAFYKLYNEKRRAGMKFDAFEPLRKRGEVQFRSGNVPGILETLAEGSALLEGKAWDERQRFIASLTIEADRLVMEPNQELSLSLVRIFPTSTDKAFGAQPTVTFLIAPAGKQTSSEAKPQRPAGPITLTERIPIGEAQAGAARRLTLADGAYTIIARIEAGGQQVADITQPLYVINDFSDQLAQLSKQVAAIKSSNDAKVKAVAALVATPEFQIERLRPLNKGRSEVVINPIDELDLIEARLAALAKGENPFAAERGEIERAYQATDGKLIPYRLFVPASYDGKAARPLVVLLHGALGDERTFFSDLYDPATVKGEAERRGYILAAVNGRSRFSSYRDAAGDDPLEVAAAVMRNYQIDPARVYLAGHSMGGFGTWVVAARKPELFAALAPMSAGPPAQDDELKALLEKLKPLPALVVHGAKDGILPPDLSKQMVEAAQKAGLQVTYLEVPDADHLTVIGASFAAVLDFFDKHAKTIK